MVNATKEMFSKYATFSGRTSRANFWWAILGYYLLTFCIGFVLGLVCGLAGLEVNNYTTIVSDVWILATFLPLLAMEVRRLHDTNRSGWWLFIAFVPLVGAIVLLVFLCSASVNEGNTY